MSELNDSVEFRCSKCGYTRQIPRSKLASGQTRFRVTCPKCKEKSILDLSSGDEHGSNPAGGSAGPVSPLQALIQGLSPGAQLDLPPGEFLGQITIDKPMTLQGQGKKTWIGSRVSPAVRVISQGVTFRDLMIEMAQESGGLAILAQADTNPILENVVLRGSTIGVSSENFRTAAQGNEESPIKVTFTPPPPISGESTAEMLGISPLEAENSFPSRVDQKIESLFQEADKAEQKQDWQGAIEAYKDILQLSPDNSDAKKLLERARMKLPQALVSAAPQPASAPQKAATVAKSSSPLVNSCSQLLDAARRGSAQEIESLLNFGCDVDGTESNGWTALMFAVGRGHIHVVRLLLQHGADVNRQGNNYTSALELAVRNGHSDIVSILVQHGADVNLRDSNGESPLDLALARESKSTIDSLVKAGAKSSRSTNQQAAGSGCGCVTTIGFLLFTILLVKFCLF